MDRRGHAPTDFRSLRTVAVNDSSDDSDSESETEKTRQDETNRALARGVSANVFVNLEDVDVEDFKIEILTDAKLITSDEMRDFLQQFRDQEDNMARIQYLIDNKLPHLFTSDQLIDLISTVQSVKTKVSVVTLIGPRLVDPTARHSELLDLFRFSEEKEKVENVLKKRAMVIGAQRYSVSRTRRSLGGRGASPNRNASLTGRGGSSRQKAFSISTTNEDTTADSDHNSDVYSIPPECEYDENGNRITTRTFSVDNLEMLSSQESPKDLSSTPSTPIPLTKQNTVTVRAAPGKQHPPISITNTAVDETVKIATITSLLESQKSPESKKSSTTSAVSPSPALPGPTKTQPSKDNTITASDQSPTKEKQKPLNPEAYETPKRPEKIQSQPSSDSPMKPKMPESTAPASSSSKQSYDKQMGKTEIDQSTRNTSTKLSSNPKPMEKREPEIPTKSLSVKLPSTINQSSDSPLKQNDKSADTVKSKVKTKSVDFADPSPMTEDKISKERNVNNQPDQRRLSESGKDLKSQKPPQLNLSDSGKKYDSLKYDKKVNLSEGTVDSISSDSTVDNDHHNNRGVLESKEQSPHRMKSRSQSVDFVKTPEKIRQRPQSISFDLRDNETSPRSDDESPKHSSVDGSDMRDTLRRSSSSINGRPSRMKERSMSIGSQSPHMSPKAADLPPVIEAKPWYEEETHTKVESTGGCGCIIS